MLASFVSFDLIDSFLQEKRCYNFFVVWTGAQFVHFNPKIFSQASDFEQFILPSPQEFMKEAPACSDLRCLSFFGAFPTLQSKNYNQYFILAS
jgi:hypothetical protein